jgi:Tol biopolymer transport system component
MVPAPDVSSRLTRIAALLAGVMLLASACKGGNNTPPGTPTVGASPVVTAPLAAGDVRFLLARRNVIENITLSGQQGTVVQLDASVNIYDLAQSPDGKQLAFVVERPAYTNAQGELDFGADLYVSDLDGGNAHLLLEHANVGDYFEAPAWLNESTLIVGWRGADPDTGSSSRIETVDVSTAASQVVLNNAAMGNLTPDRQSIVYTAIDPQTRVQKLELDNLTASDEPRILVDENSGLALFSAVQFSPDGSVLAFAAVDVALTVPPPPPPVQHSVTATHTVATMMHPFAQDVWVVNPDGTGLRRVAEIAENRPSVTWSGDGAHIYALGPNFLWRLDPATNEGEQLRQSGERGSILWLDGD